jgi:hypothetical protein
MKNRLSLWLLPLLAGGALAQDTVVEEEQPLLRRYTVEMIIFAYAQNVSTGSEIFVPDVPPAEELVPEDSEIQQIPLSIRESSLDALLALQDGAENEHKYELVMLNEENFALRETYEHLELLDAYEPLMHFGWTQPTYPDEEPKARPLSSFMTPATGLQGDLSLYLGRYLHLAINLQLDAPSDEEIVVVDFEDALFRSSFEYAPVSYPVRYRIEEDRIFRNGELRYFDHPKFGVLAKITRVEETEEDDTELSEILDDLEMLGD